MQAALVRGAALQLDELRGVWISSVLAERGVLLATSGLDELVASFRDYRAMRLPFSEAAVCSAAATSEQALAIGAPPGRVHRARAALQTSRRRGRAPVRNSEPE